VLTGAGDGIDDSADLVLLNLLARGDPCIDEFARTDDLTCGGSVIE
jgi:hypothetical protein